MLRLRAGLNPEEQEELVLAVADGQPTDVSFRWEEEKEFHYQGKMYDLISKKMIDDKLHIRCIEDSKEEQLLKQLTDIQERKEGTPTKSKSILQFLFAALFIRPEISLGLPNTATSVSYYDHYLSSFTAREKEVLSPPPRA